MEFIREKIKDKPLNKKRIATMVGVAAVCGIVFAGCASIVLAISLPAINGTLVKNTEIESQQSSYVDESESSDVNTQQQPEVVLPNISMSITDYQELQSQLYAIGKETNRAIVTVTGVSKETDWMNNSYEAVGQGSGVIMSSDENYLYILTEMKNITDAKNINVTFIDDMRAEARLLKSDANTGITILTVEKSQLDDETKKAIKTIVIGNSYAVEEGTIVMALGNPLGTNYSVLAGNVTSKDNEMSTQDVNYTVFTTNIVANEKGSGILVNTKGELVGVVIQDFSGSQDSSTLTAVAISEVSGLIETLSNGKDNPYMGIYVSTVTEQISKRYDIPKGVFVREVVTDSPAMLAGLQSGDVIVKMNDEELPSDTMFSARLQRLIPGTTCELVVKRQDGDKYYEITCTVEIGVMK